MVFWTIAMQVSCSQWILKQEKANEENENKYVCIDVLQKMLDDE